MSIRAVIRAEYRRGGEFGFARKGPPGWVRPTNFGHVRLVFKDEGRYSRKNLRAMRATNGVGGRR